MARVQVSFKNNERENELYNEVEKAYDKSAFIKECIAFYLENKDKALNLPTKELIDQNDLNNKKRNDASDVDWDF